VVDSNGELKKRLNNKAISLKSLIEDNVIITTIDEAKKELYKIILNEDEFADVRFLQLSRSIKKWFGDAEK